MPFSGRAVATKRPLRYVVQEHHASTHHFDFRLERDGVLKSWAVPKGIPEEAGIRHLAVQVDDHPLDYAGFEGEIPEGQYGAGKVSIWDSGTYTAESWQERKIVVAISGRRVGGAYVLVKLSSKGKGPDVNWIIFRKNEEGVRTARTRAQPSLPGRSLR